MHTYEWKCGYADGFNGCTCYDTESAEYCCGYACGFAAKKTQGF